MPVKNKFYLSYNKFLNSRSDNQQKTNNLLLVNYLKLLYALETSLDNL